MLRRLAVDRVVIAGAGVAALEAALALRALAEERVELVLIAPEPRFVYRPTAVAEPFGGAAAYELPVAELAQDVGARLVVDRLAGVQSEERVATTASGDGIRYDAVLVACGARPGSALAGTLVFGARGGESALAKLLQEIDGGRVRRLAFALPSGPAWSLPLYELALLTAARARAHGDRLELAVVTPEEAPLAVFGREASETVAALLSERGIDLLTARHAVAFDGEILRLAPEGRLVAERVVTLPRLFGQEIAGLPRSADGFIPADPYGRVLGLQGVYAAGDATAFPVKHGGLAADQACAAAEAIAAGAGARLEPKPFEPVLRGLLLTGEEPRYLRAEISGGHGAASVASAEALWWPAAKITGRHLPHYLAARLR